MDFMMFNRATPYPIIDFITALYEVRFQLCQKYKNFINVCLNSSRLVTSNKKATNGRKIKIDPNVNLLFFIKRVHYKKHQ